MASLQSQIAHVRQLCCLGLPCQAIMPDLMKAVRRVMDCQSSVFMWFDGNGDIDNIFVDIFLPEVVNLYVAEYENLKTPYGPDLPLVAVKGQALGNYRVMPKGFYKTDMYNLICRPYAQHYMLDAIIKHSGVALGGLMLYREKAHKEFSATEQTRMTQLLPYIQHALVNDKRIDGAAEEWGDEPQGVILADRSGRICHIEPKVREALFWMEGKNFVSGGNLLEKIDATLKTLVAKLCSDLNRVFGNESGPVPSVQFNHHCGTLKASASLLTAYDSGNQDLVCISVTLKRHRLLTIMSRLESMPLSPRQKELSLLMGMGYEPRDIVKKMNISANTYKEYLQAIYGKLHIRRKEDFYAILTR